MFAWDKRGLFIPVPDGSERIFFADLLNSSEYGGIYFLQTQVALTVIFICPGKKCLLFSRDIFWKS